MENLAQLRALHAKEWAPSVKSGEGGSRAIAKKVPAQIIQNGLLGAFAFALEDNEGHLSVFKGVIRHFSILREKGFDFEISKTDPGEVFQELCSKSSDVLRAVTAETMEYLNYLRRFVR